MLENPNDPGAAATKTGPTHAVSTYAGPAPDTGPTHAAAAKTGPTHAGPSNVGPAPDAGSPLDPGELARVPFARPFTLVGYGGWPCVLDDSAPLLADALGAELPDGRALVHCQITACGCGGVRLWSSAQDAAATHGSHIIRPT